MMVKVLLCEACAEQLRAVVLERGEEAMGQAAGPILAQCSTCRPQLPAYKLGRVVTKMYPRPPVKT
jgi:hypothetical protein